MTVEEAGEAAMEFELMAEEYESSAMALEQQAADLRRMARETRDRRERVIQKLVA